jgi:ubiquinone/menaquinone biosynthesis C-methylase UbiE
MMTAQPFSEDVVYEQVNRHLVARALPHLDPSARGLVLDLACGTGLLTSLLIDEWAERPAARAPAPRFLGVDLSRASLRLARDRLDDRPLPGWAESEPASLLVNASGVRVPLPDASADLALLGNAIHLFDSKEAVVREVARVLRSGGVFALNSAFYAGTIVPGTEAFYGEWMRQAVLYVNRRKADESSDVAPRKRCRGRPAFSNRWLTPEEYRQLVEQHGFTVLGAEERTVALTERHFEGLCAYTGTWETELAAVLMSGYPPRLASEALVGAVAPAFRAAGVEAVPRRWMEIVGVRTP